MEKNNYLPFCRYYKGEEENPYKNGDKNLFWFYEEKWIALSINKDDILGDMLDEYISAGLSEFNMMDDTPITLKALLFNRYCHWCGGYGLIEDAKAFKKFYLNSYKKEG
ncbi:hypothetical protein [uncultured Bacteroides sp.]|uniref:hypothetical protein n=1 Tax=uncultured Bacteroides sp. TaxID=162156 RepID=UPI0025955574|nr:hypothetical protein [uncultured Bacteroides sp.]